MNITISGPVLRERSITYIIYYVTMWSSQHGIALRQAKDLTSAESYLDVRLKMFKTLDLIQQNNQKNLILTNKGYAIYKIANFILHIFNINIKYIDQLKNIK